MNDNNKYDALKEVFCRKLENHRTYVDSSDWEAINNRLHNKPSSKKKIIAVWSAVAASLAIILTLAYLHNNEEIQQFSENQIIVEDIPEYANPTEYTEPALTTSVEIPEIQVVKNNCKENVTPEIKDTVIPEIKEIKETINNFQKEPEKQPVVTPTDRSQNKTLFTVNHPVRTSSKKKKELLLAASFGTSSGVGNFTTLQYPQYNLEHGTYKAPDSEFRSSFSNNELIPVNTDGEYSAPLSFGLSIRKNLSTRWGIETGLVYTYLSSHYYWKENIPIDASQQLHYLGVPVNGVIYLWNNNPKWNVYLSAGAMLEKGLWMKTVRSRHENSNYTVIATQKSDIDGWQWSLNSSLGISYRFAKEAELYAEPRFSYFFDNEQPMNIRTDWPVSIGIGAGLRYSF